MKFDVIIGNPPYQVNDGGGNGDSAKPIYNLFIRHAKLLMPNFICFITPSRWMKGGKGLDSFREEMMDDRRIKTIHDFTNSKECFPGVNIDGGVSYFLWDKNYKGVVDYNFYDEGYCYRSSRYLRSEHSDVVIRDSRQVSIIRKVKSSRDFSFYVSERKPFGLETDLFNNPSKYGYNEIPKQKSSTETVKIYGVKGKKGGAKRTFGFISEEILTKRVDDINSYKLFFSKGYSQDATVPPEIIIGGYGEACTETFLMIGPFKTENQMDNALKFIKTKFFRALLFFKKGSFILKKSTFSYIPVPDLDLAWSDEMLYEFYHLSEEEINYIENKIAPME